MKLPALDLDALRKATLQATNRQLSRHLLDTFGPVLAKLPTEPECVPRLVDLTGELLAQEGLADGCDYSISLLPHFLLGVAWWGDPACKALQQITQVQSLNQQERLALLSEQTINHRQRLENVLPTMHDLTLALLTQPKHSEDLAHRWHSISQAMTLRGIAPLAHETSYCLYEADACKRYGLAQPTHKELNGNEILAYRYYGRRMPQPSDDLQNLPPLQRYQILLHVLLAIAFGRFFHANPLFSTWVSRLDEPEDERERHQALIKHLVAHQRALKE